MKMSRSGQFSFSLGAANSARRAAALAAITAYAGAIKAVFPKESKRLQRFVDKTRRADLKAIVRRNGGTWSSSRPICQEDLDYAVSKLRR
jgi:hypothetical protein